MIIELSTLVTHSLGSHLMYVERPFIVNSILEHALKDDRTDCKACAAEMLLQDISALQTWFNPNICSNI